MKASELKKKYLDFFKNKSFAFSKVFGESFCFAKKGLRSSI